MNLAVHQVTRESAPVIDIVLPVYNEEAALAHSVRRLNAYLNHHFPFSARITIADNGSTDGTWAIAKTLELELRSVRTVHLTQKGRGGALAASWLDSDALVVAYMDVDLSTDLNALLPLVAPLVSGHSDISIGCRLAAGARVVRGPKRELMSRAYNLLLKLALSVRFRDAQCGFKAMRADVAHSLLPRVENRCWFFDTELLVLAERAGFRIHEVAVDWTEDPDSRVDIWATALEDLLGVVRVGRGLLTGKPLDGLAGRLRAGSSGGTLRQLVSFGLIGVVSTAAYAWLFWLLRPFTPPALANAAALVLTAIANTAANRRLTFDVQGSAGLARDYLGGLLALAAALIITNFSIAALQAVHPYPSRPVELLVMVAANATATLVRFAVLRTLILHGHREGARLLEIPRRHS